MNKAAILTIALSLLDSTVNASVLDQYVKVPNGQGANQSSTIALGYVEAQTFKVGIGGTLAAVGVEVETSSPLTSGDLTLEIRGTTLGMPIDLSQSPLLSVSLPSSVFSGVSFFGPPQPFGIFDVSSFQLPVTPGEVLAIDLKTADEHGFDWHISDQNSYPPNIYAGGARFVSIAGGSWITGGTDNDQGFSTYISPLPEPSSIILALGGGVLLIGALHRRRRQFAKNSPMPSYPPAR
jgi:hypothetical protein